jgi:hypothetical protein
MNHGEHGEHGDRQEGTTKGAKGAKTRKGSLLADRDRRRMWDEFIHGPGYDPDPERRYFREHGGHCSGGGGCS